MNKCSNNYLYHSSVCSCSVSSLGVSTSSAPSESSVVTVGSGFSSDESLGLSPSFSTKQQYNIMLKTIRVVRVCRSGAI